MKIKENTGKHMELWFRKKMYYSFSKNIFAYYLSKSAKSKGSRKNVVEFIDFNNEKKNKEVVIIPNF